MGAGHSSLLDTRPLVPACQGRGGDLCCLRSGVSTSTQTGHAGLSRELGRPGPMLDMVAASFAIELLDSFGSLSSLWGLFHAP